MLFKINDFLFTIFKFIFNCCNKPMNINDITDGTVHKVKAFDLI